MRPDQVNPCANGGHITKCTDGRCVRCGEVVGRFNAMAAATLLQQSQCVRQPCWEPGVYLKLDGGWVKRYNRDGTSTTAASIPLTLQELLGPWELFNGNTEG